MKISINKIYSLTVLVISLWFISELPYFNLVISPFVIFIIVWFISIFLFRISGNLNIILGILAIVASFPWLLVGNRVGAENFGVFAFLALLVGLVQEAWRFRNKH